MSVKLYEIDTVIVGRFNPHIISPPWLAKEQIIKEGESLEVGIAVAGRSIAFRFKTGDLTWQIDYNRLIISTESISDTAAVAAKVVRKLPHTPLTAIGNNFRYRCSLCQWEGRFPKLDDCGVDELKEHGDVQSVGWKASIGLPDELTINAELNLEPTQSLSPLVTVSLNYHRQVGDAAAVIAAAPQFAEDRRASEKLIGSLFGEKVEQ